jgi:hypothetical protein
LARHEGSGAALELPGGASDLLRAAEQERSPATQGLLLPASGSKAHRLRKLLLVGASVLALAAAGYFGWEYWTVGRFQVSTDDAYVKADNTTIAPKVSGYIGDVLVGDNEEVKTGEVLARIDDRDFRVALERHHLNGVEWRVSCMIPDAIGVMRFFGSRHSGCGALTGVG